MLNHNNGVLTVSQFYISEINPSSYWCVICLPCSWILFANILLRDFTFLYRYETFIFAMVIRLECQWYPLFMARIWLFLLLLWNNLWIIRNSALEGFIEHLCKNPVLADCLWRLLDKFGWVFLFFFSVVT